MDDEVRKAVSMERVRIIKAIYAIADEIAAASPFPRGSGEPVAVAVEHMVHGCRLAAKAVSAPR